VDNEIINLLVNSNMTWAAALTIMSIVLRPALVTLTAGLVEARRVAAKAIEARNINEVEQTKVLRSVENGCRDGVYLGHDGRCASHHVGAGSELDPPRAPRGDAQSGH